MKSFTAFLMAMLLSIPLALFSGVVFKDLWGWFLVPLGLAPIGLFHAAGLLTIGGVLKAGVQPLKIDGEDADPISSVVAKSLFFALIYLFAWGAGAIWHALMPA